MCKPDAVERGWSARSSPHRAQGGCGSSPWTCGSPDTTRPRLHQRGRRQPFFGELILVTFATGPVVAMGGRGPDDGTWHLMRTLIGQDQVEDAQLGSIRGDFATTHQREPGPRLRGTGVRGPRDRPLVPELRLTPLQTGLCPAQTR